MKDTLLSARGNSRIRCHICKNDALIKVAGYTRFPQVTSDCKLWKNKSLLCVCEICGSVQKLIDRSWKRDIESIYLNYTLYHQAEGKEQAVFNVNSGYVFRRSERILQYLLTKLRLPSSGRYLDVGCGNGNTLRYFSAIRPLWSLAGAELNPKFRNEIENIPGQSRFYSCSVEKIPGTFDLISMFHLLEHIVNPIPFLIEVRNKMSDKGYLVIDIPDYMQNPFDLFMIDHCTHFTISTLRAVLAKAGFGTVDINSRVVPKELVVIAKIAKRVKHCIDGAKSGKDISSGDLVARTLLWVKLFLEKAKKIAQKDNFGIFGTAISATWLFGEVGRHVRFFIDEDPLRQGRVYMSLPVYCPEDIPKGSNVFFALPYDTAKQISKRLHRKNVKFYIPPSFKKLVKI